MKLGLGLSLTRQQSGGASAPAVITQTSAPVLSSLLGLIGTENSVTSEGAYTEGGGGSISVVYQFIAGATSGGLDVAYTPVSGDFGESYIYRETVTVTGGSNDGAQQNFNVSLGIIDAVAGSPPSIADGQAWTVDDTVVNIDASASGAGLTWSYVLTGSTAGVTINAGSGLISGTATGVASGTATVTATDQHGRTVEETFTWSSALRPQATGGADLDLSFVEGVAIAATDLAANWTTNGNTLSYAIFGTAIPASMMTSAVALMTGTPDAVTPDATYTLRSTDEYGRTTDDTFTLEITAAGDTTAPILTSPTWDDTTGTGSVTSDEVGTLYLATYTGAAPTASGAGWAGTTLEEFMDNVATIGSNPFSFTETAASATATHFAYFVRDAAGNNSIVETQSYTHDITGPTLVPASCTPADGATDIAVDANITLIFSETVVAGSGNFYLYDTAGPTLLQTIAVGSTTIGTTDVVINPTDFANGLDVSVRWDAGVVEDQRGNAVAVNTSDTLLNFSVVSVASNSISSITGSPTNTQTGGDEVYEFTSSGSFVADANFTVTHLILAGGGSGGSGTAGGGGGGAGAGGLLESTFDAVSGQTYTVTVGAGGASVATADTVGNSGGTSGITGGTNAPGSSTGGGAGGSQTPAATTGGSGGGAGGAGSGSGAAGTAGQGNAGGADVGTGQGAGGGGAGAVGADNIANPSYVGGPGGAGTSSSITGSAVTYGGGGGGGGYSAGNGAGGSGGGGAGGQSGAGVAGTDGLGGGGGGGGDGNGASGAGGDGVVIIRFTP